MSLERPAGARARRSLRGDARDFVCAPSTMRGFKDFKQVTCAELCFTRPWLWAGLLDPVSPTFFPFPLLSAPRCLRPHLI